MLELAARVAEARPDELVLADAIGVGAPGQVRRLVQGAAALGLPIWLHLHNARNTGYVNAFAGLEGGLRSF